MSKQCVAKWIYLVVFAAESLRTTNSIEEATCEMLKKQCVLITECALAIDLVKARKAEPLREMLCGHEREKLKVCCPVDRPIVFTNDTETATSRIKTTTMPASVASNTAKVNQYGLPTRNVCGSTGSVHYRIFGGDIASIEEFPWLVRINSKLLVERVDKPAAFNCGGSLISDRYVLTAAHCVHGRERLSVRLGEWDTETSTDCYNGICSDPTIDLNVTRVLIHPSFNRMPLKNDIALLLLEKLVNFTVFVRPVCLPISEYQISQDYVNGAPFWTAGWGVTEFGSTSVIKRKVSLVTVPIDVCRNKWDEINTIGERNVICAGGEIGKDTCAGDSGGPLVKLVQEDGHMNWYLYGITSSGKWRCGVTDAPSLYTRVTSYMDWIINTIAP